MDPLRQALALHIGLLSLDALEAKTQLQSVTKERDSALRQVEILRARQVEILRATAGPRKPKDHPTAEEGGELDAAA